MDLAARRRMSLAATAADILSAAVCDPDGTPPDETWIYPGDGNDTTLGTERPHLAEMRVRGW